MKLQQRIVSFKRHTIGYVVDGAELTRREAVELARRGYITNARVVKSVHGPYLMGSQANLYDLPTTFPTQRRFANKLSK